MSYTLGMDNKSILILGDALTELKKIEDQSIDLCITDPPYFIDGLGDEWDKTKVSESQSRAGVVGGLPVGMKGKPPKLA